MSNSFIEQIEAAHKTSPNADYGAGLCRAINIFRAHEQQRAEVLAMLGRIVKEHEDHNTLFNDTANDAKTLLNSLMGEVKNDRV